MSGLASGALELGACDRALLPGREVSLAAKNPEVGRASGFVLT